MLLKLSIDNEAKKHQELQGNNLKQHIHHVHYKIYLFSYWSDLKLLKTWTPMAA